MAGNDSAERVKMLGATAHKVLQAWLTDKLEQYKTRLVQVPVDQVQAIQGRCLELQDLINKLGTMSGA